MSISIKLNNAVIERVLWLCSILGLLAIGGFCVVYISSTYDRLAGWYLGLTESFYRKGYWTSQFFTSATKSKGNSYCIVGILIAVAGVLYGWQNLKRVKNKQFAQNKLTINYKRLLASGSLLLLITIASLMGKSHIVPSNDEAFSAVNCAGIPPFITLSYYMLPNNHVLFNLLNNLLFHSFADKVTTGRVISLFAYWGAILIAFQWLRLYFMPVSLAFLVALTLALQLPVWGFSFQARGYELQALASWWAFISLYKFISAGGRKWLASMCFACICGYACVPTFLYFHTAIIGFGIIHTLKNKNEGLLLLKYQLFIILGVFLFYLPCLCFSGTGAITGNIYVVSGKNLTQLISETIPTAQNFLLYCFSLFVPGHYMVETLLFLFPVSLLFNRNYLIRALGWFYILMWLACIILAVIMKSFPLDRTLPGQFSITLALCIYSLYNMLTSCASKIRMPNLFNIVLPIFVVLLSINFLIKNKEYSEHYLCHFPVNYFYGIVMKEGILKIPKGSTVSYSDESFYWYYLCFKNGCKVRKVFTGSEDYYVTYLLEPLPAGLQDKYEKNNVVGDYVVYKLK